MVTQFGHGHKAIVPAVPIPRSSCSQTCFLFALPGQVEMVSHTRNNPFGTRAAKDRKTRNASLENDPIKGGTGSPCRDELLI